MHFHGMLGAHWRASSFTVGSSVLVSRRLGRGAVNRRCRARARAPLGSHHRKRGAAADGRKSAEVVAISRVLYDLPPAHGDRRQGSQK